MTVSNNCAANLNIGSKCWDGCSWVAGTKPTITKCGRCSNVNKYTYAIFDSSTSDCANPIMSSVKYSCDCSCVTGSNDYDGCSAQCISPTKITTPPITTPPAPITGCYNYLYVTSWDGPSCGARTCDGLYCSSSTVGYSCCIGGTFNGGMTTCTAIPAPCPPPACTDQCTQNYCSGNNAIICGDNNSDGCKEATETINCANLGSNYSCSNGYCACTPSDLDCASKTCIGQTCNDGCGTKNGTKDCRLKIDSWREVAP